MRENHEFAPIGPEFGPEAERKANRNRGKKVLAVVAAGLIVASATIGISANKNRSEQPDTPTSPPPTEAVDTFNPYAGEYVNGLRYDYSHYADREGKETRNAYDYDTSECFDNREGTISGILEVAARTPEALASYSYNLFTDEEKSELGIDGMTITEIDNYMSDENNADGGAMQGKLLNKMSEVLNSEHTELRFYKEDGNEDTNYIYFVDSNGDGNMTPDELHLGYDTKKRNGAPQVDVVRHFRTDGDTYAKVKMLDLNMLCGFQPNYTKENLPKDLPHISSDTDPTTPAENETPTNPSTPDTPSQRGKQGDPHGGDRVTPSGLVDPNSEVTKEQNDNTNAGNQGYADKAKPGDASTPPGSSSSTNGFASSEIIAPGATTDEGRLSGGANQGTSDVAGENPYHDNTQSQGNKFGQFDNDAQSEAQNSNVSGGDNNSGQTEEARFTAGDF